MSKEMRKIRTGTVVRTRSEKTAVVEMVWKQRHRLYRKQMRRVARFYVHDPLAQCQLGDIVRIQEVRPISKTKRWRLIEILERHIVAEVQPMELEADAAVILAPQPEVETAEPVAEAVADDESEDQQAPDEPVAEAVAEDEAEDQEASDEPVAEAVAEDEAEDQEASDEPVAEAVAEDEAEDQEEPEEDESEGGNAPEEQDEEPKKEDQEK